MVNASDPTISPAQVRAARAWLNWNQDYLAKKARVSKNTLNRFEQGLSVPYSETSDRLRKTLEAAGIRFMFLKTVAIGISCAPPVDNVSE
ncbi:DNA-binding XRE family transcriptional regulator [Bradyrhizobium sp. AZCC 1588]|uniref:helix-turn-helix domain-containing protein n=1 Tax=unclassified Bradyrhizobium TaxID=2631580 RepID=UPI002FEFC177